MKNTVDLTKIKAHHLFSLMSDDVFGQLVKNSRVHNLKKGNCLFQQNDEALHFYYVIKGTIRLYRTMLDGTEKIIELVPAGHSFGEALVFEPDSNYPVTAEATENSVAISFVNSDYLTLLKSNPEFTLQLLGGVTKRLRMRLNEIELLSLKNATHRVVRYLIALIDGKTESTPKFKLPAAKRLIAGHLGIRAETFSRVISKLKEEEIISLKGGVITVLDRQALLKYE